MKKITNKTQLQKHMERIVNDALRNEIADYVKERLKASEQRDVIESYTPVMYERRSDGLTNVENMKSTVRKGRLKVIDLTPMDEPRGTVKSRKKTPYALTEIIETGAPNIWNDKNYRWMHPRRFVEHTRKYLEQHPEKIKRLIKARFK